VRRVGDLLVDKEHRSDGAGVIMEVNPHSKGCRYKVLCPGGGINWFGNIYIEEECELVSESR